MLAADAQWAPDTPLEVMNSSDHADDEPVLAALVGFTDSSRWNYTASAGFGMSQGQATVLTWSIVPDGTSIHGYAGEDTSGSNLVAFLDNLYGAGPGGTDYTRRPWFSIVESVFDRWEEVSGIDYVYEPNDDGMAFMQVSMPYGLLGTRGDVRLAGHVIDGSGGNLAYAFQPNFGDVVLDTSDGYFSNTSNNSLRLRNLLAHEVGHTSGLKHVTPNNGTKLMESVASTAFEGPQFNEILAVHRGYGDQLEEGSGNDSVADATRLGTLATGQPVAAGTVMNTARIEPSQTNFVSIDDDSDIDYFRFYVSKAMQVTLSLSPQGPTYAIESQQSFNAKAESDLKLELFDTNGTSLLAAADSAGLGGTEVLRGVNLPRAGTYYIRVSGDANAAQLYRLLVQQGVSSVGLLAGDFNSDGSVGLADYSIWRDNFGRTGLQPYSPGDANGDGLVNQADYQEWRANFGQTASAIAAVIGDVEPVTVEIAPEAPAASNGGINLAGFDGLMAGASAQTTDIADEAEATTNTETQPSTPSSESPFARQRERDDRRGESRRSVAERDDATRADAADEVFATTWSFGRSLRSGLRT
jgi:serralysin